MNTNGKNLVHGIKKAWKSLSSAVKYFFVPAKATIIRDGGATLWVDDNLTNRGSLLKKGEEITIIGETDKAWKIKGGGFLNKTVVSVKK